MWNFLNFKSWQDNTSRGQVQENSEDRDSKNIPNDRPGSSTDSSIYLNSSLLLAIKKGEVETVSQMLDNKDAKYNIEEAFRVAVYHSQLPSLKLLVKKVGTNKRRNSELLRTAVSNGATDIVKYLHLLGVNPQSENLLARNDDRFFNLQLVDTEPPLCSWRDKDVGTLLHRSTILGDVHCVRRVLQDGCDVNCEDETGVTALIKACLGIRNRLEIIKILLDAGADVNRRSSKDQDTALITVCRGIKRDWEVTVVTVLLDAGAEVNLQNKTGRTALHEAARSNRGKIVKILIERGAKVDIPDRKGISPLMIACCNQYLIPLFMGGEGFFPVYWKASLLTFCQTFPLTCSRGIFGKFSETEKLSPLCTALVNGKPEIAKYLADNLFLTKYDVSYLANDKVFREKLYESGIVESTKYIDEQLPRPCSLQTLSFVEVSTLLGYTHGREDRVKATGLPMRWQEKLMFMREEVVLGTRRMS